jgi:hypothetical protein
MTGHDIDSKDRATLPPANGEQADEFEEEFLDEVTLPDPKLARAHWDKVKPRFTQATKLCRGFDFSRGASPETVAQVDMESRWELFLRSKFSRAWTGSPADLERFPQPQS